MFSSEACILVRPNKSKWIKSKGFDEEIYSLVLNSSLVHFLWMQLLHTKFSMLESFNSFLTRHNFDNIFIILIFMCLSFLCQRSIY